jgi:thioredoxin reductase/bacterioferritin-associated ferredoxin
MSVEQDLIVIGAGPAGVSAAAEASKHGLQVTLIDEAESAGGQIYRATPREWTPKVDRGADQDLVDGDNLRRLLATSNVRHLSEHTVWAVAPGFEVRAVSNSAEVRLSARKLLVCSGVTERIIPFPGWTTPGVIGLAGCTGLLKAQQLLPGRRPVIAGSGPLLYAVANAIIEAGGKPAAIADLGSLSDWIASMPQLLSAPDLLAKGIAWRARILKAGVPVLHRHRVSRALGDECVDTVELTPVDASGAPQMNAQNKQFSADCLIVGHGLVPSLEVTRLLNANHRFDSDRGGWIPEVDAYQRTSIPNLYAAGDCCGVSGARAAALSGQIAGLRIALDSGALPKTGFTPIYKQVSKQRIRAERFGNQMGKLMSMRPGLVDGLTPDTIVCRCEDITLGQLNQAIESGASDCNELKAWTRCGMGPCQGRTCGEAVSELMSRKTGSRENAGYWTARVPLRPCPIDLLAPVCSYDEIWNSDVAKVATAILPAENVEYLK